MLCLGCLYEGTCLDSVRDDDAAFMDEYDDDFSENSGIETSAEWSYGFSLTSSGAFPIVYDATSDVVSEVRGDPERGSGESAHGVPTNEGIPASEGTAPHTASDSCGGGKGTSGGASTMGSSV